MHKILVVEDEKKIAEVIKAYLEREGYLVTLAFSGSEALKLAEAKQPSLIVLDLMLPDLPGEEVCREIRQKSAVPIIMVTARSAEEDKISGLNIGADDYLTKPFSPRELVARIKSLLRRAYASGEILKEKLEFNDYLTIDIPKMKVLVKGKEVHLTAIEFKLLTLMAKNVGRVFNRFELINKVQGYDFEGYERTVDAHIKNLRQKIEENPKKPKFIKTVFGVGYKFET